MPRPLPGTGSCATSQLQPTQIHTRANHSTDSTLLHNKLIKTEHESMSLVEQAQNYLEKQGYAPPDVHGGKAVLSYMLRLLAHCAPLTILPRALKVLTIILDHESSNDTAHMIADMVLLKLSPVLHLMDHVADTAQEAVEDTRKAADHLYRTGEETRDELQKGLETAKDDLLKTMGDIKDSISKLTEAAAAANSAGGMPA